MTQVVGTDNNISYPHGGGDNFISTVVVVKNEWEFLPTCLTSLREALKDMAHEIIVVSTERNAAREKIGEQPGIKLTAVNGNENWGVALNAGLRAAVGNFILVVHGDAYLPPDTVKRLREILADNPRTAIAAARTNRSLSRHDLYVGAAYTNLPQMLEFARQIPTAPPQPVMCTAAPCLLARREALLAVGGWTEAPVGVPYFEFDLCMRLLQHGYYILQGTDVYVHHNAINGEEMVQRQHSAAENEKKFAVEWGFNPLYSANTNLLLLNFMDMTQPNLTVLDIGCACGGNLMYIKYQNPAAELYGIEHNANAAKIASLFADVTALDVMKLNRPDWRGKFSYIILGDVLEHLPDSEAALRTLTACLSPKGKFLISLPNLLHFSVWRNLLEGDFRYDDSGIMDKTHLRFFTRKSILRMLDAVGLTAEKTTYFPVPPPPEAQPLCEQLIKLGHGLDNTDLTAYQYQIVAKLTPSVELEL